MTSMRIDGGKSAKVWANRFKKFAQEAIDDGVQFFWCDDVVSIEKDGEGDVLLEEAE